MPKPIVPEVVGPVAKKLAACKKNGRCSWLMKTETDVFSISDLKEKGETRWDGVRNYQARNFMMQDMQIGDLVLIYHSNAEPPGVVGIGKVASKATPDVTAFDKKSEYYDPKSDPTKPRWFCVSIAFVAELKSIVPLDVLRSTKALADMLVIQRGQRLSIQPVSAKEFQTICDLGGGEK